MLRGQFLHPVRPKLRNCAGDAYRRQGMAGPCRFLFDLGRKKRAGDIVRTGQARSAAYAAPDWGCVGGTACALRDCARARRTKKRRAGEPGPCGERNRIRIKAAAAARRSGCAAETGTAAGRAHRERPSRPRRPAGRLEARPPKRPRGCRTTQAPARRAARLKG